MYMQQTDKRLKKHKVDKNGSIGVEQEKNIWKSMEFIYEKV